MKSIVWQCVGGATVGLALLAMAADPPSFKDLRYEEDSAAYGDVEATSLLGSAKYISLNEEGTSFLSLGGQLRARFESWDNFGFNPANQDEFALFRIRLHGDLHLGSHVRAFVEARSAEATDRDLPGGRRVTDVDSLDLQNAFLDLAHDVAGWNATLRLGRQELLYGAQRVVHPSDWANARRTFDGARAIFERGAWRVDVFAVRPVIVKKYEFNEWDRDQDLYGVYATRAVKDLKLKYDVYLLRLDRDNLPTGDDERYTAGLRVAGTCLLTGIEYDLEGGWQFGDAGDNDVRAWFGTATAGYSFNDLVAKPRIGLGYDYASGDSHPEDGTVKTYNQFFPAGHAHLGLMDMMGRQNIQDFSQSLALWPIEKKLQLRVDHHFFWRAEREDAAYNAAGGILRDADASASREIGSEVDVTAVWSVNRNTSLQLGYSRFIAGDFIKETGPSDDVDFYYASMQYTF
ncbi:MAG: alginate export family protein [Kiritimatiellae bacterium]|nr:alginate export family protein [Kiritimatiellia bacterium]MCO5044509.1 alginate export family protein [Kiritimatiellia bacterium]MCO5067485.1 alginate export family protein [Kiritimatiellia bacterium]